ncbi:hypothetical protein [Reichenbachiella versicolor]|uniref:hypothetical protein n=1 Tax=Reichenbachiella versicolor TaxID=1821036 RepID=UPI000D6E6C84|nr:hypothetical protein [Reichenbachiella versicolor]
MKYLFLSLFAFFLFACDEQPAEEPGSDESDDTQEQNDSGSDNPIGSNFGFTALEVSSDSRTIYVSNSEGDDKNDCFTDGTPCKTLAVAMGKMREGYPDHLYLKSGDSFIDENLNKVTSGRSKSEPTVVSSYGDGPRPIIGAAGKDVFLAYGPTSHLQFIGLHFYAYKLDPDNEQFDGATGSSFHFLGGFEDVLLEDNVFDFMELKIASWESGGPKDFVLRRNIWTGAYINTSSEHHKKRPSNLYVSAVDGLVIEENVFDYGGWHPTVQGAGANTRNHNLYIVDNNVSSRLFVRNNIITRGSSHGIHGRPGGTYDNNFFGRNSIQLGVGYSKVEMVPGEFTLVTDNVMSETASMYKGTPVSEKANGAIWGFVISKDIGNPDYIKIERNIITKEIGTCGICRSYLKHGYTPEDKDNVLYDVTVADEFENPHEGPFPDPERTLATYSKTLGQEESFDAFMNIVKSRAPKTWDDAYSADAINDYFREGFGLEQGSN